MGVFRILFGFALGCMFTFYSFPFVHGFLSKVGVVDDAKPLLQSDEPAIILNPNPPISLNHDTTFKSRETAELKRIMHAVSLSQSSAPESKAPDFVVSVIKDFVTINPNLGYFVRERINDGINNKEALEIISKHVSERTER